MDNIRSAEKNFLSTEMTVGGRAYELLGFLRGNETSVAGRTMVKRAKKMNANLGKEDGQHILDHQDEIPAILRGRVYLVFTDWSHPDGFGGIACIHWEGGRWIQHWDWFVDDYWYGHFRVLRRKQLLGS